MVQLHPPPPVEKQDYVIGMWETLIMEEIPELFPYISGSKEYFIIDSGLRMVTISTQQSVTVPRYTVWVYNPIKESLQIVEAGDSVEPLQKKYGVKTVHSRFNSGQSAA